MCYKSDYKSDVYTHPGTVRTKTYIMDRYIIGTCEEMCPKKELFRRAREGSLHQLEVKQGSIAKRPRPDPSLIVKEFRRSAAGYTVVADDIRPIHVLKETIIYLIQMVLPRKDVRWNIVYDFIFDRIRAIRQDLVIQNAKGTDCKFILKTAVKFYLYSAYRLCEEPLILFDPHINSTHLQECLKLLMKHFDVDHSCFDPEMVSLYLLHNLESNEALSYVIGLPRAVISLPHIKMAINFVLLWKQKNYIRVMRLINSLTFFQGCAVHFHMEHIRRQILTIMSHAYNRQMLPYEFLREALKTNNEDEVEHMCEFYGINTKDQVACISKTNFNSEKKIRPSSRSYFVERKLVGNRSASLILGEVNGNKCLP